MILNNNQNKSKQVKQDLYDDNIETYLLKQKLSQQKQSKIQKQQNQNVQPVRNQQKQSVSSSTPLLTMQKLQYAEMPSPQRNQQQNSSIKNSSRVQQNQQSMTVSGMRSSHQINQNLRSSSIFSEDQKKSSYIDQLQKRDAVNLQIIQSNAQQKQKQELTKKQQLEKRKRLQETYTNMVKSANNLQDDYLQLLSSRKSQQMQQSQNSLSDDIYFQNYQQYSYKQPEPVRIDELKQFSKNSDTSDSLKQQFNAFTFDQQTNLLSKGSQHNSQQNHQRQISTLIKDKQDQEHTRAISYSGNPILFNNNNFTPDEQDDQNAIDLSTVDEICKVGPSTKFNQQLKMAKNNQNKLANSFSQSQQQNNFNYHQRQQSASMTCGKPEDAKDKNHTRQESYVGENIVTKRNNKPQQVINDDILEFSDSQTNMIKSQNNNQYQQIIAYPMNKSQTVYFTPHQQQQESIDNYKQQQENGNHFTNDIAIQQDQDRNFLEISDSSNIIQQNQNNRKQNNNFNQMFNQQNPFEYNQNYTFKNKQEFVHERQQSTSTCGPARSDDQEKHTRTDSYVGENIIQEQQDDSYSSDIDDITAELQKPDDNTKNFEEKSNTVIQMPNDNFNQVEKANNSRPKSCLHNEVNVDQQEIYLCSQSDGDDDVYQQNRRETSQYIPNLSQVNQNQNEKQKLQVQIQTPSQDGIEDQVTAKFRPQETFQQNDAELNLSQIQYNQTVQQIYERTIINSTELDSSSVNDMKCKKLMTNLLQIYQQLKQASNTKEDLQQIKQQLDELQSQITYSMGCIICFSNYLYQFILGKLFNDTHSPSQWVLQSIKSEYQFQKLILCQQLKNFSTQEQKQQLDELIKNNKLDQYVPQQSYQFQTTLSCLELQEDYLLFCIFACDAQQQDEEDKDFVQFYKDAIKILYNDNELVQSILK